MSTIGEPKDGWEGIFRIWGYYKPDVALAWLPSRPTSGFIAASEIDNGSLWLEFEVEQLKGCEPEILTVRFYDWKNGKETAVKASPALEVDARDWLTDDHAHWADMRSWLVEQGERDLMKEAA
jgi:hypothetical protein